ncbi:MAG: hypothetical protein P4L83_06410 [Nevskia sp.]|nr:hypothetical protein [Nevskia sp.]
MIRLFLTALLSVFPPAALAQGGYDVSASLQGSLQSASEGRGADLVGNGMKRVTTLAALRALSAATTARAVFVDGCYGSGDGGGGLYMQVQTDTTSGDNGGQIVVDANARRWYFSGQPTIKTFCVLPSNTSATNTTNLNAALAWGIATGNTLKVPSGTYLHGRLAALTGPVQLKGDGGNLSILKVDPSAWPYAGNTSPIWSSAYDFYVDGVGFDQSWLTATFGYVTGTYKDGLAPSTWGGNWLGTFSGAGTVSVTHCWFYNIARGFYVYNATNAIFNDNNSNSVNAPAQAIFATSASSNVQKDRNHLTASRWNAGGTFAYGLAALDSYGDTNVEINHNILIGHQVVGHSDGHVVFVGNIVDTPIADTHFDGSDIIITSNVVLNSGDAGITTDGSNVVVVNDNVVDGTAVGGILIGGNLNATVVGNVVRNWAQDYSLINAHIGRYASGTGGWLSGIYAGYTGGNTGGSSLTITGNTLGMQTLPPVSDAHGTVRAAVSGIRFDPTGNPSAMVTGAVTGNYVPSDYAELPSMFVFVPSHRFYLGAGMPSGTPVPGEVFSNGTNSFVYLYDQGAGNFCFVKKVTGTITSGVAYTGAKSGGTIYTAATPGLQWMNVVDTGNFDWTTVYSPH